MAHIFVVCTGNTCRSPVGEALLRDRLQKRGLTDWQVESAGTWAQEVRGASRYSVEILAEQGLDIREHRSQMITRQHLQDADLVLCMESGHVEALRAEFPEYTDKIYLFSEMVGHSYSISDPFGQSKDAYYRMVKDLTEVVDEGLDTVIELASQNDT